MSTLFPADLIAASQSLLTQLQRHALLITTAESCTGGLLAGVLTEVPGSSGMVERGFITYSNASKSELLGVSADLIARHGAVSEEASRAMAEGALARTPAHIAVSITGIAGPDGGSSEKPIGLVYVSVAAKDLETRTQECRFGDIGRCEVRLASVREALKLAHAAVGPGLQHD